MYQKTVEIVFVIEGQTHTVRMHISCVPETPDNELRYRAHNIFCAETEKAVYNVLGDK
jgi:hypothetical protein